MLACHSSAKPYGSESRTWLPCVTTPMRRRKEGMRKTQPETIGSRGQRDSVDCQSHSPEARALRSGGLDCTKIDRDNSCSPDHQLKAAKPRTRGTAAAGVLSWLSFSLSESFEHSSRARSVQFPSAHTTLSPFLQSVGLRFRLVAQRAASRTSAGFDTRSYPDLPRNLERSATVQKVWQSLATFETLLSSYRL